MDIRCNLLKFLSFICLLPVLLGGCASNLYPDANREAARQAITAPPDEKSGVEIEIENRIKDHAARAGEIENLSAISARFTEDDYLAVKLVIDATQTFYPHTDISNVENALAMYRELPEINNRRELTLVSGDITAESLFRLTKRNNEIYKDTKGVYASVFAHFDDDYLMWVCEIAADTISRELNRFDYPAATLYEFEHTVQNLCIFKNLRSTDLAGISLDGVLSLSPVWLDSIPKIYDNEYAIEQTIAHEVMHLLQRLCNETRDKIGIQSGAYGYCRNFGEELEVNSLYYNWHIEASAEWLAASLYIDKPVSYSRPIGYLETLIYTSLFKDSERLDAFPRLTFQSDIDKAFEFFGADTFEKQAEFLNMMYAIEIIQFDPKDFVEIYEQQVLGHIADEDDLIDLKVRLRSGVLTTISKYFYQNLSEKLLHNDIPLDELFLMLAMYEAKLAYHSEYHLEWRFPLLKEFFHDYTHIQDEFFNRIAGVTGIPAEKLHADYDTYNATLAFPMIGRYFNTDIEYDNIEFLWLTGEKNGFLTKQFGSFDIIEHKTLSIKQVLDIYAMPA